MNKIKENNRENYLERIPVRSELFWSADKNGIVTLDIENKGIFNRLAQKVFHRPKISHIHLDQIGSFIWPLIDGERNIRKLAGLVDECFGKKAAPLYERLAKYFQILYSYHFIQWKEL